MSKELGKSNYVRTCFIIANFFLLICGFLLLIAGSLYIKRYLQYVYTDEIELKSTIITVLVFGTILPLVTIFGFAISVRPYSTCMPMYIFLLCALMLGQLGNAVAVAVYLERVQAKVQLSIQQYFLTYSKFHDVRLVLDRIQSQFQCCGIYGPSDYSVYEIPRSCYTPNKLFYEGCTGTMERFWHEQMEYLTGITFCVLVIEIGVTLCAGCYWNRMKMIDQTNRCT